MPCLAMMVGVVGLETDLSRHDGASGAADPESFSVDRPQNIDGTAAADKATLHVTVAGKPFFAAQSVQKSVECCHASIAAATDGIFRHPDQGTERAHFEPGAAMPGRCIDGNPCDLMQFRQRL